MNVRTKVKAGEGVGIDPFWAVTKYLEKFPNKRKKEML